MNRRQLLLNAVKGMFIVLGLAFAYVLIRSLSGPSLVANPAAVFDDIEYGQTAPRRFQGQKVWATRLTPALRRQADTLKENLLNPDSGCAPDVTLCVVSAKTERDGIEIVYTKNAPKQLSAAIPWFGGFVNPVNGAVYDRLGRAYRLPNSAQTPALPVLPVE